MGGIKRKAAAMVSVPIAPIVNSSYANLGEVEIDVRLTRRGGSNIPINPPGYTYSTSN
jgi:hypothetical protein